MLGDILSCCFLLFLGGGVLGFLICLPDVSAERASPFSKECLYAEYNAQVQHVSCRCLVVLLWCENTIR